MGGGVAPVRLAGAVDSGFALAWHDRPFADWHHGHPIPAWPPNRLLQHAAKKGDAQGSRTVSSFARAGPSVSTLQGRSSFVRSKENVNTGARDDASFIVHGSDGMGGRMTVLRTMQRSSVHSVRRVWQTGGASIPGWVGGLRAGDTAPAKHVCPPCLDAVRPPCTISCPSGCPQHAVVGWKASQVCGLCHVID